MIGYAKHPVTGIVTPEELADLAKLPYGKAKEKIRERDPQWGREEGEQFEWRVEGRCNQHGYAYVMAADEDEANEAADDLCESDFDWDYSSGDFEILSVEPNAAPTYNVASSPSMFEKSTR